MKDDRLIEYLFNLCSEKERRRIEAHLADSPGDRARLDALKAKFTQLDLVKDEIRAPEQLIADTLRRTRLAEPRPAVSWARWFWLAGTAAAAAVLLVVFVPRADRILKVAQAPATEPAADSKVYEVALAKSPEPMDALQPLPENKAESDFYVSPPAAPPAAAPLEFVAGERETPAGLDAVPAATTLPLAKVDARDKLRADNAALGLASADRSRAKVVARKEAPALAARRPVLMTAVGGRPQDADQQLVIDLSAANLQEHWTAGAGGCVTLSALRRGATAEITVSNGCEDGVVIRWNGRPLVHLTPNTATNIAVEIEAGESK
jgi:hypothetical protein